MKCTNCGVGIDKRPLHRTKPKGQTDAGWMCMPCIEKSHPELAKNIKEDQTDFEKMVPDIFYPNRKP